MRNRRRHFTTRVVMIVLVPDPDHGLALDLEVSPDFVLLLFCRGSALMSRQAQQDVVDRCCRPSSRGTKCSRHRRKCGAALMGELGIAGAVGTL